jgi:hypothetical protein
MKRVYVADTHEKFQRLVAVVKMATVLEDYTTKKKRSVVRFCRQKDSMQRIFTKKCFLFTVGSVCHVQRFTTGSRNSLKDVRKSQIMPEQIAPLRMQQKQRFLHCGFRRTGKVMGYV